MTVPTCPDSDMPKSEIGHYFDKCQEQAAEIARLREQIEHLSQYARCSEDRGDGIAHGGAALCQSCVNRLREENERLRDSTRSLWNQKETACARLAAAEKLVEAARPLIQYKGGSAVVAALAEYDKLKAAP